METARVSFQVLLHCHLHWPFFIITELCHKANIVQIAKLYEIKEVYKWLSNHRLPITNGFSD